MDKDAILEYLTNQIDLLQRKAVELSEQRDEIDRQLKNYKDLMRDYRRVFEAEQGVGILNQISMENIESRTEEIAVKMQQDSDQQPNQNIQPNNKNIRWAVYQILESADVRLNTKQVCHLLTEQYPEIASSSRNLSHTIGTILWKGRSQGIYELVGRGIYRLKREK
ncbi:hypothetical protein ACFLVC_04580 [Chloroflexota bacterium]